MKEIFDKTFKCGLFFGLSREEAKIAYISVLIDVEAWIRPQRNDIPASGEEFANTIRSIVTELTEPPPDPEECETCGTPAYTGTCHSCIPY